MYIHDASKKLTSMKFQWTNSSQNICKCGRWKLPGNKRQAKIRAIFLN